MKRFKRKIVSVSLIAFMLLSLMPAMPQKADASFGEMPKLSLDKCKKAEVFISDTSRGVNMEFIDGGTTDPSAETYAAITTYGGEICREVTAANKMNFKFSEDFASSLFISPMLFA